ncbi:RHS repeat-associated protein [Allocatelliglobosispora scoriae]|uniref:RHS repeat-associated protein n=1 Tax=Allocatelliglobosispora scoriae TaxID=643052 RepID=A0A841BXZ4_9ACTN|nr:LamG-like jellyroll fold domain-containing protein [Allocatelliglobosispora scoriae]MBB5872535.1 RHS repeat-associated protein [Allocatelliglobosispora scoriae]
MLDRSALGVPTVGRRKPRRSGRRIAFVTTVAMLVALAAPAGTAPAAGEFPLAGLWSWLQVQRASAARVLGVLPPQKTGSADGRAHYSNATDVGRGAGRKQLRAKGGVPAESDQAVGKGGKSGRVLGDFDKSKAVKEKAGSNATSDVYRNPDGTYTRIATKEPVNYRAKDGSWQPIDRTLVADKAKGGRLRQKANSTEITLASKGADEKLAELTVDPDRSIGYGLIDAADVTPVVEGNTARYPEIRPGVDLLLEVTGEEIKESLILKSAAAGSVFDFPLHLKGLTVAQESDGTIIAKDADGKIHARVPSGFMFDSLFDRNTGDFTRSDDVRYELITVEGEQRLRVVLDRKWLNDPARVWPVTADPTLYGTLNTNSDTYVYSTDTADHSTENNLAVGTFDSGTHKARALLNFSGLSANYNGNTISKARLHIFLTWTWDCTPRRFDVYASTAAIHVTTDDWPGPTAGALIGNATPAPGSACTNTGGNRSTGTWVDVDLNLTTVQQWVQGVGNYGIIIKANSETTSNQWKRFTAGNYSSGAKQAQLQLWYAGNVKPQVDSMYPVAGYNSQTLTPTLIAHAHDPDNTSGKFTYEFIVKKKNGDEETQIWTSGKISASQITVPPNLLSWGQSYVWTVKANDSIADSTTINYPLSTPVPQPVVTSTLSQNGGKGFAASIGNYTTGATDASVATVGPPLTIQRSYNSLDNRAALALGQGWSSLIDTKLTESLGSPIAPPTVIITYPGGNELAFGKNADGTFSPPAGRYATLTTVTGGYRLVDKEGTTFLFTTGFSGTAGTDRIYGITSITDVNSRAETFTYDVSNRITDITSASGRALHLAWATPAGAAFAHVSTIKTDQLTPGDDASRSVWTYNYTGDKLTSVCTPAATGCASYTYAATAGSPYRNTMMNLGPSGYWRVGNGGTGIVADEASTGNANLLSSVSSVSGPLAASGAQGGAFNGTSTAISLPSNLPADAAQRSISMWFQMPNNATTGGILAGQSREDISAAATTKLGYNPTLYVDATGYLHGQFPTIPTVPSGQTSVQMQSLMGGKSGMCLDIPSGASTPGLDVQLSNCNDGVAQEWTLTSTNQIKAASLTGGARCLEVDSGTLTNGARVQINTCTSSLSQQWYMLGNGTIIGAASGRCLSPVAAGVTLGTLMEIRDCVNPTTANQVWSSTAHSPIKFGTKVNDGNWHHAVLSAGWSSSSQTLVQTLYVDGVAASTTLTANPADEMDKQIIGAGYLNASWPNDATVNATNNTGTLKYFTGSIAEVAYFGRPLTQGNVNDLQSARAASVKPLTQVNRPTGGIQAKATYDAISGLVTSVTDENNGVWGIGNGALTGSHLVHSSTVLGARPSDYWRMGELTTVNDAVNEVDGGKAVYNDVFLGLDAGPFDDPQLTVYDPVHVNYSARFEKLEQSYVALPADDAVSTGPASISLWFKTDAGGSGVLYSWQNQAIGTTPTTYVPALYIGTDHKLHGKWCWCGGSAPMVTTESVDDGKWHHVVLTTSTTNQILYLDGVQKKTYAHSPNDSATYGYVSVGAGYNNAAGWTGLPVGGVTYFDGNIGEVSYYKTELTANQVGAEWGTRDAATGPALARKYVVTDPSTGSLTSETYGVASGQRLAQTDALGKQTQYGYDEKGFLLSTVDPLGHATITFHDARGNTIQRITCQDQSAELCSSAYYEFFPDKTTAILQPNGSGVFDPRNDKLVKAWGQGTKPDDPVNKDKFLTTYTYNPATGDEVAVLDPLGRAATITYTDGTTVLAYNSTTQYPPAGLPYVVTTSDATTKTILYYPNGDLAQEIEPTGKTTTYTYDLLGRVATQKVVTDSFPSGLTTTYTYDKASRVKTQTDPGVLNRVTGSGGTHTAKVTWTYNDDGLRTTQLVQDLTGGDASRTLSSEYNGLGQLTASVDGKGKRTEYTYDAFGHVVTKKDPNLITEQYDYDAAGQVLYAKLLNYTGDPNAPIAPVTKTIESRAYDDAARLTSITNADGTTTNYEYTNDGLTAKVTRRDAAGRNPFVLEETFYDDSGFVVKKITNNGATTRTFVPDVVGRAVTSVLDPLGPLKQTTNDVLNPDDQPLTSTTLDALGNVVAYTESLYDTVGRQVSAVTYNGDPATTPVGRWKLNETTGTKAADSSGNSPGKLTNATWTNDVTRGPVATFNGTSSNIGTGAPVVDTTRSFSAAAWLKLASESTNQYAVTMSGAIGSTSFKMGYKNSTDQWVVDVAMKKDDGTIGWINGTTPAGLPVAGTWAHVAATMDIATTPGPTTGTLKIYVNGTLQGTFTTTFPFNNKATTLHIGSQSSSNWFNGSISDVQVYQRALTAAQVGNIYTNAAPAAGAHVIRTSAQYDTGSVITASTDSRGNKTGYTIDEAGRQVITATPEVLTEVGGGTPVLAYNLSYVGYDTFGEATETKDATGNRVVTEFDANGRVTKINLPSYTQPGTGTVFTPYATRTYDDGGRLLTETNPLNQTTSYTYDQLGRVVKTTAPGPNSTTAVSKTEYDIVGNVVKVTAPEGGVSGATYDHLGRQLTTSQIVTQDSGSPTYTTTNVYGAAVAGDSAAGYDLNASKYGDGGWLVKSTSPGGVVTKATYNSVGQPLTTTDGANKVTSFEYGPTGLVTKQTRPDASYSKTLYDFAGRAIASENYHPSHPDNTTPLLPVAKVSNTLDFAGNVTSATDARNHTTTFAYDATNLLVNMTEPIDASNTITSTFGYDAAGHRTRFTDGRNNSFITTYNTWGLPESTIEPVTTAFPNAADRTYTVAYDAGGRVVKSMSPGGVSVTNTYDTGGNLETQTGTGAEATTASRSFTWDKNGRLTAFSGAGALTNTISYDDRNLPRSILGGTGGTGDTSYTYWPDGQIKDRTDAAGQTSFTYDTAGRPSVVTNTTAGIQATYHYTDISTVNDIVYGTNGNKRTFLYDRYHTMKSDVLTNGSTVISSIAYGFDASGNETSKTTSGFAGASANSYSYDWANRLTQWDTTPSGGSLSSTTYQYDKAGNRTKINGRDFVYDERNRLVNSTTSTYTYSARGALRTTYDGTNTIQTKADAFDQIIEQGYAGGTQTYQYDATGRAIKSGHLYSGVGNDLAADSSATYVRGLQGELLSSKTSSLPSAYAWTDLHSDVVGQFSATGTTLSASKTYEPLGKVTASAGSMIGSLGYQSEWTEASTGRVNMAARWYNPDTGQFDSRDTQSNDPNPSSANANRYAYANGSPLVNTDPTGHQMMKGEGGQSFVYPSDDELLKCDRAPNRPICKDIYNRVTHAPPPPPPPTKTCRDDCGKPTFVTTAPDDSATIAAEIDKTKAALEEANKAKNKSFMDILIDVGVGFLLDMLGVNDIIDCFTKGSIAACAQMVIGFIPWGKVFKMAKTIFKAIDTAFSAYKAWRKLVKAAEEIIEIGRKTLEMLEKAQTAIDNVNMVSELVGGGPLLPDLPTAGLPGPGKKKNPSKGNGHGGGSKNANHGDGTSPSHDNKAQPGTQKNADGTGTDASSNPDPTPAENRSDSDDGASCPIPHSFDPDTPVLMADGSAKPIKDVEVGDKVTATDPETGETTDRSVTALHLNQDTALADVSLAVVQPEPKDSEGAGRDEGAGTIRGPTSTLHTTQHHPFWDATERQWVNAAELEIGHELRGPAGERQVVVAVRNFVASKEMRDLTVATVHTYYVFAGGLPALVHNCGGSISTHADKCTCATTGRVSLAVREGEVGFFGDLDDRARQGDNLTPNHTPQAALGRLPYRRHIAHVMFDGDHKQTRTYGGRGQKTARDDAGLTFRQALANDMWDLRRIGYDDYDDPSYFNAHIKGVIAAYKREYPALMKR